MNRFRQAEKLAAATREEIPRVSVQWLAAVRAPLEELTMAALDPDLTDAEFVALVEKFSESLPGLFDKTDHDALADLMERGMGAGMANGILQRRKTEDAKTQDLKAKLPWESDVVLAGRKTAHDPRTGRFTSGPGGSSRKNQRRKPTRKEKIAAGKTEQHPNPERDAVVARYRKGVHVDSPTGREVKFGKRIADHISTHGDASRHRFADKAEKTVSHPDEVWQDGLKCFHIKHRASTGSRKAMVVITRQRTQTREIVETFTKLRPGQINKHRLGKRTFPAG